MTPTTKSQKVGEVAGRGSITSKGRYIYHLDAEDGDDHIFRTDLKTGVKRQLTKGPGEAGDSALVSPDDKWIAYDWFVDDAWQLRVSRADGSDLRVIYRGDSLLYLRALAWSPDSAHVLVNMLRQDLRYELALMAVSDGSMRTLVEERLPTLNGRLWDNRAGFSPDGKFVAYDWPPRAAVPRRAVFVTPVSGGVRYPLLQTTSETHGFLGWAPNGQILIGSDRSGTWDAWAVPTAGGKASGPASRVFPGIGPADSLGFTDDGSYYFVVEVWANDVYLADIDEAGLLSPPTRIVTHVGFGTSVDWSPDGKSLVYVRGLGDDLLDPFSVGVRDQETGSERSFRPQRLIRFGGHTLNLSWSPDARALVAQGRDRHYSGPGLDSQGLYSIDSQTGELAPLVRSSSVAPPDYLEWPVWAIDGNVIFTRWVRGPQVIVSTNVGTGTEKELYRVNTGAVSRLADSRDGLNLAFVWSNGDESAVRVLMGMSGDAVELLRVRTPQSIAALAWAADSKSILVGLERGGSSGFELMRLPVSGGAPVSAGLALKGLSLFGLSVHPGGAKIAFSAGTPPRLDVWVLEKVCPNNDGCHFFTGFDETGE